MSYRIHQLEESNKTNIRQYITYIYEWINCDPDIYFIKKTEYNFKRPEVAHFKQQFDQELLRFRKILTSLSESFEKVNEYSEGYKFEYEREKALNKEKLGNKK